MIVLKIYIFEGGRVYWRERVQLNTCEPNSSCSHGRANSVDHAGLSNMQQEDLIHAIAVY